MGENTATVTVTELKSYDTSFVENLYRTIFDKVAPENFFLNKDWVLNWLRCAKLQPSLVLFEIQSKVVGFAFIGKQHTPLGAVYYLNQTGRKRDDQIWVEYNDVICITNHEECRLALLEHFSKKSGTYQFVCNNALQSTWHSRHWSVWSVDAIAGFSTKLNNQSLMQVFSKNTNNQISRSLKFIEKEMGKVKLSWISEKEIDHALEDIAELHIEQWRKHRYGSGFTNRRFVDFHHYLLKNYVTTNTPIAKFTAGETVLGFLYFFLYNKTVYFYLSAINYSQKSNKFKPGLVMHKIAMEHFQSQDFETYDFLAGYARYKASLSDAEYNLHNVKLYRRKWYFYPIKVMVIIKRKFVSFFDSSIKKDRG